MYIYNAFGITPTNTFSSAGSDYYVPNIVTDEQIKLAKQAFTKSYNVSIEDINLLYELAIGKCLEEAWDCNQGFNIVHLFLAHYSNYRCKVPNKTNMWYFCDNFLEYDTKKKVIGLRMFLCDTLFINSGIKVALDTVLSEHDGPNTKNSVDMLRLLGIGIAGLYVNKSGMGNKGFDVRACLVDEDYAGYVHLSMSFTKDVEDGVTVFCGDKLTQMMLIPIFHTQYKEIDEAAYNEIMEGSCRGDAGFGSSDIKH